MRPIGGFLELETDLSEGTADVHPGALALSSGRACLAFILKCVRPRRVWVPYFTCEVVPRIVQECGSEVLFYGIDEHFELDEEVEIGPDEMLIQINYFGLKTDYGKRLAERWGDRLILDQSQAYFETGTGEAWSFNSARKFFGVPDGAFCYGRAGGGEEIPENEWARTDHLVHRLKGDQERAYREFLEYEESIPDTVSAISSISAGMLARIDFKERAARRVENFRFLDAALRDDNSIQIPLEEGAVPMAYPFMPSASLDRERLNREQIFIPTYWPEVVNSGDSRFPFERRMAESLLPLPIDHRYGAEDLERVIETIKREMKNA